MHPSLVVLDFPRCESCPLPRHVVVVRDHLGGRTTYRHIDMILVADQGSDLANRTAACHGVACRRASR